jgi:hypothetical protein
MAWEKVAAGQKLRQTPIHRGAYINDTIDVVNAHKEGRLQGPSGVPQGSQSRVQVEARNLTGGDLGRGQLVQLGAHLLTDVSEEHPWFEGNTVADPVRGRFAILNRPIKAGEIGPAQIAGICLAYIFILDPAHKHAVPSDGATVLVSSKVGPVELLMPAPGLGLRHVWVKLDHKENYCYHVTLSAGISAGGSGSVLLPDNSTITATNWSADTVLSSGDRCLCFKDLVDDTYYLIKTGGQPQTKIWHSTANANIAAGASGSVTLSTGTIVNATNWSNDVDINTSDKIHVYQDPFDSLYYAIKSGGGSGVRRFKGNLYTNLAHTDATAQVTNLAALDGAGGLPATPLTVVNLFDLAGETGDDVLLTEDLSGEGTQYLLEQIKHKAIEDVIDVKTDDDFDPTKIQQTKRTILGVAGMDDAEDEDVLEWSTINLVQNVAVDSTSDPTKLYETFVIIPVLPRTSYSPSNSDIVDLEDIEVDTDVKTDSPGNPTKLQQTKRTIKSFPKPDDSADSDIIGIEEC